MNYPYKVKATRRQDFGVGGQIVIFTDLDGTLLDAETYSFAEACGALTMLEARHIPLVICSSKTRSEIEHYRSLLRNTDPFICENGGGIFIPKGYMLLTKSLKNTLVEEHDRHYLIRLGTPYEKLRQGLHALREKGFLVRGFGDMTVEEVSQVTGLPRHEAFMARQREFDEPFVLDGPEDRLDEFFLSISELGLNVTQGAFYHLLGDNDKGKAVSILAGLYKEVFPNLVTIGIGDSPNDTPMLRKVNIPAVVRKPDGSCDSRIDVPNLIRARGIGPIGWAETIKILIEKLS